MEERTPGRRSFLLPGPTFSGFLKPGKVGISFSYKLWTDARNGPPPGWAGWEAWVSGRRDRVGKNPAKTIFPKESFQIRVRTWVSKKTTTAWLRLYPKRGSERAASGLKLSGCRAEPCDSFPLLSYKESRAPAGQAPPRGAAPRGRFRGTACRARTTGGRPPAPRGSPPLTAPGSTPPTGSAARSAGPSPPETPWPPAPARPG